VGNFGDREWGISGIVVTGANLKSLNQKLKGLVPGPPDAHILEAVPAGDVIKGAIHGRV
jgi:hypothetical protein